MKTNIIKSIVGVVGLTGLLMGNPSFAETKALSISGVYPHLTMRNNENECGTGAVVPWQGSLWAITYAPHKPNGSSDQLYEITPDLQQQIFSGSVGGTPANRMIHKETRQLLIGPYLIDGQKNIRVIPPTKMYGRLTANARHLTDPENKIYYATMEEGLYEVDLTTLDVHCLLRDGNGGAPKVGIKSALPGYHGKGMYSGQGRLVYANNGERSPKVTTDPTIPSGALAEWHGEGDWQMVRRNQFTEVTGPHGVQGAENPATDPVWAMGWDARSVILALLEDKTWHYYRLPKASHSYDGAHGWNTEWPRIREIGETDLLATMHGTFWRFPVNFSKTQSAGIAPRSNYLKVIGDFCRWNDRLVLGCDDSAKAEFYNVRPFKAKAGAPKQSNSNLWFVPPEKIDQLGPAIGRGSVWLNDVVDGSRASDPFLFSGYDHRMLSLSHNTGESVVFTLEVDARGTDDWQMLRKFTLSANGCVHHLFAQEEKGAWIRLKADCSASGVTAHFHYRNQDPRGTHNGARFDGVSTPENPAASGGLMRSLAYDKLGVAAYGVDGKPSGYYELNPQMELVPADQPEAMAQLIKDVLPPEKVYTEDAASILVIEDGKRYRLPKSLAPAVPFGSARICREVATERDLLNLQGTFYELPARNAQGMAKVRPVATHNLALHDYCSHMGLLFFTGIDADTQSEHIFRSADGKAAVWAGVVDDLWQLGKPRGKGGPWKDSPVQADLPSDPYLMTAYDQKSVEMTVSSAAQITLEIDVDGTGVWVPYKTFQLEAGKALSHSFSDGFSAYWVRAISSSDTTASAIFSYR